ncbi:pyridoxamine 5'-phosphate oxidase family protein [Mesorhizobium sp. BR1-1-16]|uniref:pyridoxamine 5'-phosphate oxidase family protein n=1 Tax=Mesorhizobium sp. BR1-1-16 TaxID=2876653 RepID=UPI001CCFBD75|nr:pyridoxamine 5'-phosphate oxidase family protein [Mesorhizobium sp. BR1-1-16]MBZ9935148.1 pyridoxamine 5'-phosphate oxidase family protein [Mesorhizobium sp. BR1-1-16]
MANEEDTGKTQAELESHVWKLAEKIQFALYTARDGNTIAQWPLTANVDREANAIYFLVDDNGTRYDHLTQSPDVSLGFADHPKYVVVHGAAAISNDRAKIKELWSPFAKAWWDSADDPAIRLLTVIPSRAEYWDSGNSLVASAVMLTAAVTGTKPAVGEHAKVAL